jgi:seryl-tRNA synthetase
MAIIAELRAELEALRAEKKEELVEEIGETEEVVEEATNEVEALKAALAKLQSELDLTKEANTALTVSSAISSYYSEGIITEDILPESTLTSVVSKLTLGFSNYSEEETPLVVIEGLLNALNRNAPVVEYGETWTEEPKEVIEEVQSVSYSTGDEMHELAVATAGKYTLSYGKALTAIVQAKELSEAKKVDFSETLSSILTK